MAKKHRRERAASRSERKALPFEPIAAEFPWTNEDWGITHLPRVRVAVLMLQGDRKSLTEILAKVERAGAIPDLLDGFIATRKHLQALVKMIDAALTRSFLVLEDLGYSPDSPPSNVVSLPTRNP